jgi:hypothetical protein
MRNSISRAVVARLTGMIMLAAAVLPVGSGVLRLLRHELELVDHSAEFGKRTDVHLPHRPATVDLHGGFGDAHIAGNLFAQATSRDVNHDFPLPGA